MIRPDFKVHDYAAAKLTTSRPAPIPVHPVQTIRPAPGLWEAAMEIADGDPSRITIISPTEIVVR